MKQENSVYSQIREIYTLFLNKKSLNYLTVIFITAVIFIILDRNLSDFRIISGFLPLILICFLIITFFFLAITLLTDTVRSGTMQYLIPLFIILLMVMIVWVFQPRMRDDFARYQFHLRFAYINFSGRFSHILISALAVFNNTTFSIFIIIRTLMFLFCIYLSLVLTSGKLVPLTRYSIFAFLLILSSLWLGIGNILAPSISIVAGSTTYLYSVFFCLLFLLPYRFHLTNGVSWEPYSTNKASSNILFSVGFFLFAFVSSGFHEQMSLPVLFFIAIWLADTKKSERPLWLYAGAAGFLIGTIIVFTAPGNFNRLGSTKAYALNFNFKGIEDKILNYLIYLERLYLNSIRERLLPYLLIFATLSMNLKTLKNNAKGIFNRFSFEVWLIFSLLSTWPFLFLSPDWLGADMWGIYRTYFIPLFLLILAFASLLKASEENPLPGHITSILFFTLFIVLFIDGIDCLQKGYRIGSAWHEREKKIEECKASGIYDVVVDPYPEPPRMIYINDITENTNLNWENGVPASFYKLKTIRVKKAPGN